MTRVRASGRRGRRGGAPGVRLRGGARGERGVDAAGGPAEDPREDLARVLAEARGRAADGLRRRAQLYGRPDERELERRRR